MMKTAIKLAISAYSIAVTWFIAKKVSNSKHDSPDALGPAFEAAAVQNRDF
jgi:hypothetical protein